MVKADRDGAEDAGDGSGIELDGSVRGVAAFGAILGGVVGAVAIAFGVGLAVGSEQSGGRAAFVALFVVPGLCALGLVPAALVMVARIRTAGGRALINDSGVHLTLRDGSRLDLPWRYVASWAVVPRRLWSNQALVVRPVDQVPEELLRQWRPLWHRGGGGWVVSATRPSEELTAAFRSHAPAPPAAAPSADV